jgi:hypothetical protein
VLTKFIDWLKAEELPPSRAPRSRCMLHAHYWNGSGATAAEVRDVSETGAYLVTADRWYQGTIFTITVTFNSSPDEIKPPVSITLACKVVRHGQDGMGVRWLFPGPADREVSKSFFARVPGREKQAPPGNRGLNRRAGDSLAQILTLYFCILNILKTGATQERICLTLSV